MLHIAKLVAESSALLCCRGRYPYALYLVGGIVVGEGVVPEELVVIRCVGALILVLAAQAGDGVE